MAVEIQVRKIDNKSTVFATNEHIFDVPVKREKEFDYDDREGVVDDQNNPDDQTIPVTVELLREVVIKYSKDNCYV